MSNKTLTISCEEDGLEQILWDAIEPPDEVWQDAFSPVLDEFSITHFARSGMAQCIDLQEVETVEHSPGLTWVMLEGEICDVRGFQREVTDQLLVIIDAQPIGVIAPAVRAAIQSWGHGPDPKT
jgi:hypothetical protein